MTSYILINLVHVDVSSLLITTVLREEWGFRSLVMSDWRGNNGTAEAFNTGHELEMPGQPVRRMKELISAALESGELTPETFDQRFEKVLDLPQRAGKFDNPGCLAEQSIDKSEQRQLIR